jgi:hypothetical protein
VGVVTAAPVNAVYPAPAKREVLLLIRLENPPTVAFIELESAARVMLNPPVPALSAQLVTLCTTAPDPSVPDVATPANCWIDHRHPVWLAPPKVMVTVPEVGAAPIARNNVVRLLGETLVPQVTVATRTQVRPFPERVVLSGVVALLLVTHARTRLLEEGVMDAVV